MEAQDSSLEAPSLLSGSEFVSCSQQRRLKLEVFDLQDCLEPLLEEREPMSPEEVLCPLGLGGIFMVNEGHTRRFRRSLVHVSVP